jgi:hypothetical protein
MASGMNNQLTKQVGEYLVACELARKGLLSATFSGNVPELDIVATKNNGETTLIQVKTSNSESWQFSINRFVSIEMDGNKQIVGKIIKQPITDLICIFVQAGKNYGEDRFFIMKWVDLQKMLVKGHKDYLKKNNGERPRNKESMHSAISIKQIEMYEDNWSIIYKK